MDIIIAGCGAIGSRIILEVADRFDNILLIDDDIIEENNIGTSAYYQYAIGAKKTTWLQEQIYYKFGKVVEAYDRTLIRPIGSQFPKSTVIRPGDLIVDSFDNPQARRLTLNPNTLHVGVSQFGSGSVMWNDIYPEPELDFERGENPVCTNHLGKQIIQLASSVAASVILYYLQSQEKVSFIFQEDMTITKL